MARSAYAASMIRSASARPSATTESLVGRAAAAPSASASGSVSRTSSSRSSTSARLTMHDADIGIARAFSISVVELVELVLDVHGDGPPVGVGSRASASLLRERGEDRVRDQPETSPPKVATSLTRLEDRKL